MWYIIAEDIMTNEKESVATAGTRNQAIHKLMGWMEEQKNRYVAEAENSKNSAQLYVAYDDASFDCEMLLDDESKNNIFIPETETQYRIYSDKNPRS